MLKEDALIFCFFTISSFQHDYHIVVPLQEYHTFGLVSYCDELIEVTSTAQIRSLVSSGYLSNNRFFVIGGGSNVLFPEHYNGVVLHIATQGVDVVGTSGDIVYVRAAAGVIWDDFVGRCIASGWYGLECLTAIPGTVGASVVQNIGAYGSEVSQFVHHVVAIDIVSGDEVVISRDECLFGYRNSCFKQAAYRRYIVLEVVYALSLKFKANLSYKALSDAFSQQAPGTITATQVAEKVSSIRWGKLPRPSETGSAGSFFKNPVVSISQYEGIKKQCPEIVAFLVEGGYKISAGWLIEHCGWKGKSLGRCGVYDKQALVLVNLAGCTCTEVHKLVDAIVSDVSQQFGITLEPEAIFA